MRFMWFRAYANGYTIPDQIMLKRHATISAFGLALTTIAANVANGITFEIGVVAFQSGAVIGEALRAFK